MTVFSHFLMKANKLAETVVLKISKLISERIKKKKTRNNLWWHVHWSSQFAIISYGEGSFRLKIKSVTKYRGRWHNKQVWVDWNPNFWNPQTTWSDNSVSNEKLFPLFSLTLWFYPQCLELSNFSFPLEVRKISQDSSVWKKAKTKKFNEIGQFQKKLIPPNRTIDTTRTFSSKTRNTVIMARQKLAYM